MDGSRGSMLVKMALHSKANKVSNDDNEINCETKIINNSDKNVKDWINSSNFEKYPINKSKIPIYHQNVNAEIEDKTTDVYEFVDTFEYKEDEKLIFNTPPEKNPINLKSEPLIINNKVIKTETFTNHILESIDDDKTINKDKVTDKIYTEISHLDTGNEHKFSDNSDFASYISPTEIDDEDDRDFNIFDYVDKSEDGSSEDKLSCSSNHSLPSTIIEVNKIINTPLSEKIQKIRNINKKLARCQYCKNDIANKNFMRHLERNHKDEEEVKNIFHLPRGSKERRLAAALLRNKINFDLYLKDNIIRPHYSCKNSQNENATYYPCAYCKGLYKKQYLKRHAKFCHLQKNQIKNDKRKNQISLSQTTIACAADPTDVISKLTVKEQVFNLMKGDDIAFEAKKDLLITVFGESYLKKHRRERMAYACSNRMRELSRLLIAYRKITDHENVTLKEIINPKKFDTVVFAVRQVAGYDHASKTFKSPSLAMHLGTSLKLVCDELLHLILKENIGFKCETNTDTKTWIENVKNFKKLVVSRWNIELASLANKDLMEKRWQKPLLLPLVNDIKIFRDETISLAEESRRLLSSDNMNEKAYKLLSQCTLALLIIFNRRRIGDVQYLKIKDYIQDKRSNYKDFEHVLTKTEKMLTQKYKRVLNSGKGSRAVVILIPEMLEKFIDVLLEHRNKYISDKENEYVFSLPGSKIKWGKGDIAIRMLCKRYSLENPQAISSNKLRKQIATVTQILSLSQNEIKQFSNFMGHTQKTHDEFYELPIDIYQTAKVSKLLLMMEKGNVPVEYMGKSLAEIDLDPHSLHVETEDKYDNEKEQNEENSKSLYSNTDLDITTTTQKIHEELQNEELQNEEISMSLQSNTVLDNNTPTLKIPWSSADIDAIMERFGSYIKKKIYPNGAKIKKFIEQTNMKRTVPVIKSKMQHLMKVHK